MYKRKENLSILQDFVTYRDPCPASLYENQRESRAGQGNRWPFDAFGLLIEKCVKDPLDGPTDKASYRVASSATISFIDVRG